MKFTVRKDSVGSCQQQHPSRCVLSPVQGSNSGTGVEPCKVLFSCCMKETHTHKAGFKQLFRRLRTLYRPEKLDCREDLQSQGLSQAGVVIFGCPRERFSRPELECLRQYIDGGGAIFVFLAEGGESKADININYLLEEFGIAVNSDAVIGIVQDKYLHPKEVVVSDGILNRGVFRGVGKGNGASRIKGKGVLAELDTNEVDNGIESNEAGVDEFGLQFVYPFGATLSIQKPAIPILSSGSLAFPMNRPIGTCEPPSFWPT